MVAVDDVVAPEVGDHAQTDGIALDSKLHRDAGHRDAPHKFPGRQSSRYMEPCCQDRRPDAAFLQAFGYLPGLVGGAASMRMKRFNCP